MYDKSAIFRSAWATYRVHIQMGWTATFGECLKSAWKHAKQMAEIRKPAEVREAERQAARQAKQASKARAVTSLNDADRARLDSLKESLFVHECKDRWDASDWEHTRKLQAQIDELETETTKAA